MKKEDPQATITNTIEISSVDDFIENIEANGGKIIAPKMPMSVVGYAAYFTDTEGNIFGLVQTDTSTH
jgi:predicted enzyme related to lactoylglutathione lyase